MTAPKSLPPRPSLESLRKQAKKLARDIAAGDAAALARARLQVPNVGLPITQRNAQLVIAREHGHPGWRDLTAEVSKRLGNSLDWAAQQARRIIHDNDVDGLKQLLAEYPALLSWQGNDKPPLAWPDGTLLAMATGAYGDCFEAGREQSFTHAGCAALLIDAGAAVTPSLCDGILESRARGLPHLFQRKGVLPQTLKFLAALGDIDAVRAALNEKGNNLKTVAVVNDAFVCACRFEHEAVASLLLERSIVLEPELGKHIDEHTDRLSFGRCFNRSDRSDFAQVAALGLWKVFVMGQVQRALDERDLTAFVGGIQRETWLLGDACATFQARLIETAAFQNDRQEFIRALLDLNPAILRRQPAPQSQAIEHAFTYANAHLLPLLTRIWRVPDDLPHAAGMGDLLRVKRWFDAEGKPALGDLANQAPTTSVHPREPQWGEVGVQQVLDTALAWSVINRHFDVADFLLEHGADINTNWNSHEPASILHHLIFLPNPYESMQFLIDRGIDMTIQDYRWNSTAQGWAFYGKNDPKMAQWLEDAERQREQGKSVSVPSRAPETPAGVKRP